MTIQEIKNKFLEIINKQNNLKGRVLDDLSEATEAYVEIYGTYPDCYYASCNPDRDATIDNILKQYECFFPGSYSCYKDEKGVLIYDKICRDSNVITTEGFIIIEQNGITIYTNSNKFREDILACYVSIPEENPCEVYWVSNGQNGFGASKLKLKDGKFNINSHYNEDFDYDKVNNFVKGEESGLIILHGIPGTGRRLTIAIILLFKYNSQKV